MDQKEKDTQYILDYIRSKDLSVITVSEVVEYSGADYLRVFNILYEMYLKGLLEVGQYTKWGVPESYIVKKEL